MGFDPYARARIALALLDAGGEISDPKGRVTAKIAEMAGSASANACASLLARMEDEGEVVRDTKQAAKRTYSVAVVELLPATQRRVDELRRKRVIEQAAAEPEPEPEPEPEVAPEPEPAPVAASAEVAALEADEVALAILRQIGGLLELRDAQVAESQNSELMLQRIEYLTAERDEARERLAATLEENQRLRQRNRDAGDELRAKTTQIQGLIREREDLRGNLQRIMRDQTSVVGGEVRKQIERFMQERPTAKG